MSWNSAPYDPRRLNNIFNIMLFAQIALFIFVLYQLNKADGPYFFEPGDLFAFALPVMVALSNIIAHKIYQQQWNQLSGISDLDDKMHTVTRAHLIQWSIVQGGTLILLVFAMLEENQYYTTLAFINIIYFITLRPKILTPDSEFQANA